MANTNFVTDVTVIEADWLNDVNTSSYGLVNVKHYASGDAVTDDIVGLNTAIALLPSGGTVYFPSGCICGISSELVISANNITLHFQDWTAGLVPLASMTNLISVTGEGCIIKNGNLANSGSLATNAINKTGVNAFGFTVKGNYIASFTDAILYSASSDGGIFLNRNYFNAQTNASVNIAENGISAHITDNHMLGGKYGVYMTHVTQGIEGVIITRNDIFPTQAGGACIYLNGGLQVNIHNNVLNSFNATTSGITLDAGITDHQITYIYINNNNIKGGDSSTSLIGTGNTSYMNISENTFEGGTSTVGLSLTDTNFSKILNNHFVTGGGTQAVFTDVVYTNVDGNNFRASGGLPTENTGCIIRWDANYGEPVVQSGTSIYISNWP